MNQFDEFTAIAPTPPPASGQYCEGCDTELSYAARYCDACGRGTTRLLHAQPGAIVASLSNQEDNTPDWMPRDVRPLLAIGFLMFFLMLAGIVWRTSLLTAGFRAGWVAREMAGGMWEQRGWAALVVVAIVGTSIIVHGRNRTYTYPERPY